MIMAFGQMKRDARFDVAFGQQTPKLPLRRKLFGRPSLREVASVGGNL